MLASRHGSDSHASADRNPTAHRQREVFDAFLGGPGRRKLPILAQPGGVHRAEHSAQFQLGQRGHALTQCGDPGTVGTTGRPRAAAIWRNVGCARRSEVDRTAGDFGFQDGTGEQPDGIVGVDDLHRAIGRLEREAPAEPCSRAHPLSTSRPTMSGQRIATHCMPDGASMSSTRALLPPVSVTRIQRVMLGQPAGRRAVDMRRRRENDAPAAGLGHRGEQVRGPGDVDLAVVRGVPPRRSARRRPRR